MDRKRRQVSRTLRAAWAAFGRLARRPWLAAALCASMSFAGSVAYAVLVKAPLPHVTDEFSHLLLADTLRHGRLTNPTHAMWQHFETFHEIHHPSYASMYPPGQGCILAAGWLVGGHPIVGVWLAGMLMTAAIWWMLRGFLPPRWALVGGLIAAAHFGMTKEWTQSYIGGALPAMGGALVAGALPRIWRRDHRGAPWMLALGLGVLANTRPFEGIVLGIPALLVFGAEAVRRARGGARMSFARLVVPPALVMIAILAWTGIYNRAVMGDPFSFPYLEHERQYGVAPAMVWLPPRPVPTYRHREMRKLWADLHYGEYAAQRSLAGFFSHLPRKLLRLWSFYLGPGLTVALLGLPCFLRRRWAWVALGSVLLLLAAVLGVMQAQPQYPSPGTAWIVLLVTGSLRELSHIRVRGLRIGLVIAIVTILAILGRPLVRIATTSPFVYDWTRRGFIADLEADGRRHLVVVRYGPRHNPRAELVWNEADIDAASVVWARDLGTEANRPLLDYFQDRTPWLLRVDFADAAMELSPYPK